MQVLYLQPSLLRMEETNANPVGKAIGPSHPTRSHRFARVLRLGKIISSSREPLDYKELATSMGVSQRTLYRDLGLLRSAGIEGPYGRKRGAFRMRPTGELLGQVLTLNEVAAILEFFEHNCQPKPDSAYDRALRAATLKITFVLLKECSVMAPQLDKMISAFHNE